MFACLMGKKQQLEFPAHSALLKRKCQLLFISPWLKIIANKKYTNKHKCLVILPLQCSSCKFPLKMTLNEKVLDKPSVIMTFAFRNVQLLLYVLKCCELHVKFKQKVSHYTQNMQILLPRWHFPSHYK